MHAAVLRYFGLSSSGITYKTGSDSSYGSGGFQSSDRYGGFKEDSYKGRDRYGEDEFEKDTYGNSRRGDASENQESTLKRKGSLRYDLSWALFCYDTYFLLYLEGEGES